MTVAQAVALTATRPGPVVRLAASVSSSVRSVVEQIPPYTQFWSDSNQVAVTADGPLLVAIGDSSSLGIGASHPSLSFIGRLGQALTRRDGRSWRIVNLAQSGARLADGLGRQLPALALAGLDEPDLVVCCLGSNDLTWSLNTGATVARMTTLVEALPDSAIVCPAAGRGPRASAVNAAASSAAERRGLALVNPWAEPGPSAVERLAADRFHPNDLGYALMARPLARHLEAPEPG